jgi:hypothetical protein
MKTKKAIASLVVIVLVIAVLLSIGALADQSNTSSYRINGSNVCLRTSPIMYGDNNVLGLVQNGEIMTVTMWSHGIDNFYIWSFGVMTTGANAGKSGYVAEPYLTPNN